MIRTCAALSAGFAAVGTLAVVVAVGRSGAWFGYLSEAGAPGAPLRSVYRLGVAAVAVAMALIAVAFGRLATAQSLPAELPGRTLGFVALTLGVAAPLALTSGAVSCTPGCPLPPYESPTGADLVHAVASVAALGLAALAMLGLALSPGWLRRLGRLGVGLTVPLGAIGLAAMLIVGRGYLTGVLERMAVGAAFGWLIAAAVTVARVAARITRIGQS